MKNKFCFNLFDRNGPTGRRVSTFVIGLTSLATANMVGALGLGEITLNSTLDQPLDAEIKLLEVRDLSESEILVSLASDTAFQRQGVDRNFFLTSIKYDVVLQGAGAPYVKVSSERPVREPFLNFILEAQWPSGKLLREYTVLLDLPVFSDETAAPVNTVKTETVQQRVIRPQAQATPSRSEPSDTQYNPRSNFDQGRPSPTQATNAAPAYSGDQYDVQRNDTLWEIALAVKPDSDVSVHQTMMALHSANPDAFINGNINLLKAGRVLRIPNADEIYSLNRQQAVREVASHNANWTEAGAAPIDASRSSYDAQTREPISEGRLSLESPNESFDAIDGRVAGGTDRSGSSEALAQELSATQETLDKTSSENAELRSKIDSLEDQIQTLESMLEVSNDSLRAIELSSASTEEGTDSVEIESDIEESVGAESSDTDLASLNESINDAIDSALTDPEVSETASEVDAESAELSSDALSTEGEQVGNVLEENTIAPSEDVKEEPKPAPAPRPQPKKSFVDVLMEYLPFIGLGIIALLAGILFFVKQRKSSDSPDDDFDAFFGGGDSEATVSDDSDFVADELEDLEDVSDDEPELEVEDALDDVLSEEDSPEPETEDVVAESDIYIAYGKYDQAEEMLQRALGKNPDYHEARLKLLEVYAAQSNLDEFDPAYATLRTGGASDDLISRAASLRQSFVDAGEFDESAHDTGQFEAPSIDDIEAYEEPAEELNIEDELSLDLEPELASSAIEPEPSFDTELDLKVVTEDDAVAVESFDLDDLDSDSESSSDDIEFDLEGLDFAGDELKAEPDLDLEISPDLPTNNDADEEIELSLDADDIAVEPASGIDLELDVGSEEERPEQGADLDLEDIEFDLEGLGDLELGDSDQDIDVEIDLDLGEDDAATLASEMDSTSSDDVADVTDADESAFELDLGDLDAVDLSEEGGSGSDGLAESPVLDLDDLEHELSEIDDGGLELELDEPEVEEPSSVQAKSDETIIRDEPEEDDTIITEAPEVDEMDDLDKASTQFDMAALDEELDALTSDLGGELDDLESELSVDAPSKELESNNDEAESLPEVSLEDELEADLASLSGLESEDAQADLDATIAEGEDILAELDGEVDSTEASEGAAVTLEAPDLDFDEADITVSASELEEPETDFELPDTELDVEAHESEGEATTESLDFELPDIDPESTDDDDLDFLSDSDETATKLDLASAYIDMGDMSGAKEIIEEIMKEGSDEQQGEAKKLLSKIDS